MPAELGIGRGQLQCTTTGSFSKPHREICSYRDPSQLSPVGLTKPHTPVMGWEPRLGCDLGQGGSLPMRPSLKGLTAKGHPQQHSQRLEKQVLH